MGCRLQSSARPMLAYLHTAGAAGMRAAQLHPSPALGTPHPHHTARMRLEAPPAASCSPNLPYGSLQPGLNAHPLLPPPLLPKASLLQPCSIPCKAIGKARS